MQCNDDVVSNLLSFHSKSVTFTWFTTWTSNVGRWRRNVSSVMLMQPTDSVQWWCSVYVVVTPLHRIKSLPVTNVLVDTHTHRALCRIKSLPFTHFMVDTWMSTVKPVYKLFLTWNGLHSFLRHNWQYLWFLKTFLCSLIFYPSTHIFVHPNDGWTGFCIKLCTHIQASQDVDYHLK